MQSGNALRLIRLFGAASSAMAIALMEPAMLLAGDDDTPTNWQNLQKLAAGQSIEVAKSEGVPIKGDFVSFTDQSITLRGKQNITLARAEVRRVKVRPSSGRKWLWIGALVGGGAGAGIGAGIGDRVANESGGDFANLKPAITGVSAGIGALTGVVIGSLVASRHTTIYVER